MAQRTGCSNSKAISGKSGRRRSRKEPSPERDMEAVAEAHCHFCGSTSHLSTSCPSQKPKQTSAKCFACGKRGHTRAECTEGDRGGGRKGRQERGQRRHPKAEAEAVPNAPAAECGPYVDACCSLHGCFSRAQHYGTPGAFFEACGLPESCEGIVARFADSACLDRSSDRYRCWEAILEDPRVWGVLGCHPRDAPHLEPVVRERLEEWVTASGAKVVALFGGLDYSGEGAGEDEAARGCQRRVLGHVLSLALRLRLPVALCSAGGAERDLAAALLRAGVPEGWRLYLADYDGDQDFLVLRVMAAWPGLCVGFDGRVTFAKAERTRALLHDVPLGRLLLQSSAPDRAPAAAPPPRRGRCHPGLVPHIAARAAELKGVPVAELAEAARENARRVYGV